MIMAIDPGLNVGIAYRFDNNNWGTLTFLSNDNTDINMREIVYQIRSRSNLKVVVIESFLGIQMQSSAGIATIELIGAVRGICLACDIPCVKQTPAQRITMVPTAQNMLAERRTAIGSSFTNHEVSALAHLLAFERKAAKIAGQIILERLP